MTTIMTKKILLGVTLMVGLTSYTLAASDLPVTQQVSDHESKEDKVEIVPEIKIEVQESTTPTDPTLKTGDACSDEKLEEAEGELIVEIPMAKTIPCGDDPECKNLPPAKLYEDNYKELKDAKTISCGK
jgi:hypothetical protein